MVNQYRSELNSIFKKINDILSLQVFSTSDIQANMEDAQMNREKNNRSDTKLMGIMMSLIWLSSLVIMIYFVPDTDLNQ